MLEVSGLLPRLRMIKAHPCTEEDLTRVHSQEYIAQIKRLSAERGGDAGEITPFGHGSFEIALLFAGGTLQAVTAVVKGEVKNSTCVGYGSSIRSMSRVRGHGRKADDLGCRRHGPHAAHA